MPSLLQTLLEKVSQGVSEYFPYDVVPVWKKAEEWNRGNPDGMIQIPTQMSKLYEQYIDSTIRSLLRKDMKPLLSIGRINGLLSDANEFLKQYGYSLLDVENIKDTMIRALAQKALETYLRKKYESPDFLLAHLNQDDYLREIVGAAQLSAEDSMKYRTALENDTYAPVRVMMSWFTPAQREEIGELLMNR